jgi:hypothetical protein
VTNAFTESILKEAVLDYWNVKTNDDILWWENRRGSNTHVVLWFRAEKFAVILAKRKDYYLLKSAYPVRSEREKSFKKECKRYWEKG